MMTTGRLRFIYLASIALALLAIVAGAAWDIFTPTPRFPEPTGPFGIGTRTYSWTDSSRPEPFTANRTDRRQIVVQVWYPASGGGTPQPYLASHFAAAAIAARFHLPVAVFRSLEHAPTHSRTDAPARAGRFPVLLNPTGFLSFRNASLFWIEELVSHGYVVVGFDQPGTAAATVLPDGRVIPAIADLKAFDRLMPLAMSRSLSRKLALNGVPLPDGIIPFLADDLRFVLDRLTAINTTDPVLAGHLDLSRAGVFGMSLGGYIGPETCRKDARLRACLAVDAGQTGSVPAGGEMTL